MTFEIKGFIDCPLRDVFFDSLKEDYPGFECWFDKKSKEGAVAYVADDGKSIQAFLYVKEYECETIGILPASPRMKIGTLKVCEDFGRRRIAEGAIGIALWKWQRSKLDEIYVTVLPKHDVTIKLLKTFGFVYGGKKGEEEVYFKNKNELDYTDPKKSFPFVNPNFSAGRYIPLEDGYHDQMFQYSDLKNTLQVREDFPVSNGITKNFIATPYSKLDYAVGDVAFIYRKHTGLGPKKYKSVITSYCVITDILTIKTAGNILKSCDEFINAVGNKTVYNSDQLKEIYTSSNVYVIEMVYNGYFGVGKNITFNDLEGAGLFNGHPYSIKIDRKNVFDILRMGGKNERDIIVNKP